jgi:transcriptional regulator with XRE-family HTH domain
MNQSAADPGAALKTLRERMGWTLSDVSERTGLTISTLSKIENNRVSLNFDKLSRLSAGLGVDIASFLDRGPHAEGGSAPGRRSTTRIGEGSLIETPNYRHVYHATDLLNKSFTPIEAEVLARSREEFGDLIRHPGEEFAYVLEGAVEVHTDTYVPLLLKQGESVFFDSGMAHGYVAAAPGPCRILSISAGPGQNLGPALAAAAMHPRSRPALQPANAED